MFFRPSAGRKVAFGMMAMKRMTLLAHQGHTDAQQLGADVLKYKEESAKVSNVLCWR